MEEQDVKDEPLVFQKKYTPIKIEILFCWISPSKDEPLYPFTPPMGNRAEYDGQTRQQNIIGSRSDALYGQEGH